MRNKRNWIIIAVILIAAVALLAFRGRDDNQPNYTTTPVERGDVLSKVEATGTINAVTTVQVGSQVSGTIQKLNADFNTQVKKGQLIAQIDPSIFEGNLLQARADLENARANLAAARANLERSKATATQTRAEYNRTQQLAKEGVFSQQQLEVAKSNYDSAEAAVNASQAQVTQAQAQVTQRAAAVSVSQTNLNHTKIIAPIDGTVIARNVDVGQTVAASLQAPTLFTIAQDLTKMQVYAKTDESDIGSIRPGQEVTFKVDAFPNQTFKGRVQQVRMNATVVQNVVTYDTVIEFDNPDMKLLPGMTAYVTIPVANAKNVLKVANNALRFKPNMSAEELRAAYEKAGIPLTGRGAPQQEASEGAEGGGAPAGGERQAQAQSSGEGGQGGGRRRGAQAVEGTPGGGTGEGNTPRRNAGSRSGEGRSRSVVVWKLNPDKTIQPVRVRVGITDLTATAILDGDLKEGDQLVTGQTQQRGGINPLGRQQGGGPGGGGGGGRR